MSRRDNHSAATAVGTAETPPEGTPDEPSPQATDPAPAAPDRLEPPSAEPAVPDPFEDAESLGELEHRITTLAAHLTAATHRFLLLVADFDRRRGWRLGGHRSCAEWLHAATAMAPHTAREKVRVAHALSRLPRTSEAMARGELSFSQVRELSRMATPECEEELIEYARSTTVRELERFVRMWRTLSAADEQTLERARYRLRRFSVVPDTEGMYVVRGRVTAEVGAVLMRAIDAAGDALFCEQAREETTAKQRRADALGLVAERAMAAGFGGSAEVGVATEPGRGDQADVPRGTGDAGDDASESTADGERGVPHGTTDGESGIPRGTTGGPDAEIGAHSEGKAGSAAPPGPAPAPLSGSRAERYQVLLHVTADGTHLDDGTGLTPETSRRLGCDSAAVRVTRGPDGSVLDVGRRTRTIPPALRRALEVRDGGCVFPGCGLRFTDGHHLTHWSEGGDTSLDNLVLLCRFHHRTVHEGGWRVERWGEDRRVVFIDPGGGIHVDVSRPPPEVPDRPVDALIEENGRLGVEPTGWALWARHQRSADVPWPLRARAVEALDAAHFGA